MLLYYLHGMYKEARKRMAETKALEAGRSGPSATASSSNTHSAAVAAAEAQRTRSSRIEMAMHDWTQLLNHANEAALKETWQLPPEELFQRILVQINRSKRDILQDKYNQCKDPACPLQTRSAFIRSLKRIAESFVSTVRELEQAYAKKLAPTPTPKFCPKPLAPAPAGDALPYLLTPMLVVPVGGGKMPQMTKPASADLYADLRTFAGVRITDVRECDTFGGAALASRLHDFFTLRTYFDEKEISFEFSATQFVGVALGLLKNKSSSELEQLERKHPDVFEVIERRGAPRARAIGSSSSASSSRSSTSTWPGRF